MTADELPEGWTWDALQAKADQINARRADWTRKGIPVPGDDVDAEWLARCYREEQAEEAKEAAAWAALTPVEQAAMTALEAAADEETNLLLDIIRAAKARRPGVVTARELLAAMMPGDSDFAEVTAAMARIDAVCAMQGIE